MPHRHTISLVDLAVKSIVMEGAFELVRQLRQGFQNPQVQSYTSVDIVGTNLFGLITSVRDLFMRLGSCKKAFERFSVQEALWPLVVQGKLKTGDIDALIRKPMY